jgi:hypothetical protein
MQNYANHRKYVPAFHFVAVPILVANFLYASYHLNQGPDLAHVLNALTALALVIIAFTGRIFALRVQDRVIRLEMRQRLREVLPSTQHDHIVSLTPRQFVGLRYASDAELPALVEQIVKENISDANTIKKMVKEWQADDLRA